MRTGLTRRAACLGAAAALGGCSTLSSLEAASERLDVFELTPAAGAASGPRTARTLTVIRPDAPAALETERILVKPNPLAVQYLPGARWSDDAPVLVQSLLTRSIAASGRVGYVGRDAEGPVPDYALLSRLDAFQVEALGPADEPALRVVVRLHLTVVRDEDQTLVASRAFDAAVQARTDEPLAVVAAFDAAMQRLLPDAVDWTLRALTGGNGV